MINIVIPMAGLGSRFSSAGYDLPKPLINVWDTPMIQVVLNNLTPKEDHRFILVAQRKHVAQYNLKSILEGFNNKNIEIVEIDGLTEGQVCTVLKAKGLIDSSTPLLTANSDQFIDFDVNLFLKEARERDLDGLIMTMESSSSKWSYARVNERGLVVETAEKKPISKEATTGIYYFKEGSFLVSYAEEMIKENVRVNNEFYTCPVYNYMIKDNKKVGVYNVGIDGISGMYGIGTPEDLEIFLANPQSKKWVKGN